MAKKSGSEKKKKGPKGKRARAKAKLERQWGEEANEDTRISSKRVGKSRILSRREKVDDSDDSESSSNDAAVDALAPKKAVRYNSEGEEESDDDPEEGDLDLANGGAYSKLMQTIRRKGRDGSDAEDEEDMDMDQANEDKRTMGDDSEDESDDDEEQQATGDTSQQDDFDLFGSRFSKEPLPEEDAKREEILQSLQQTTKLGVPHVHPMLELQASQQLVTDMKVELKNASKDTWKKLAKASFSCNQSVLKRSWADLHKKTFSAWQAVLYPFVTRYADCLITCDSVKKREQAAAMALLHIVNHVLTSRGPIQRQNRRLKQREQAAANDDDKGEEQIIKDQGYTRPTVLVLLPTRGTCHTFLHQLLQLLGGANVPKEYMERFDAEYGPPGSEEEEGDDAVQRRRKKVLEEKGASWQALFGDSVNDDDDFKIGVALNAKALDGKKKTKDKGAEGVSAKLYTDFYSSDIIVASPLGLKMAMDANEGDADFLSSIEICFMNRSDVMMMQNWDHVNDVLKQLNQLPANNNDTDFARVREYFLVNQAAHWRQLIMLTDLLDPTILSSLKRFAKSHSGQLKTRQRVSEDEGSIANVIVPVRQVFQRIPVQSIGSMSEDRMKYMIQKILPSLLQGAQKHTLIYTPSYFDHVLVRNHLIKNDAQFVSVTEYSRITETSRGRARFHQGRKPLMLYTGRAHFFLRHKIKGVRHLIFFGLPEHAEFYSELVNVINEGLEGEMGSDSNEDAATSIALFTKYEAHALERIVGTSQSNRMVKSEKSTFMFVS